MPNKHCWQSVFRLQLRAILLHDLKGLNIVQTPFKKHKDVSGWKIRPFANALRTKNLDTYAWSLHIFTDLFKIHIAFMGLTLFSKTRKNASVFKIFRILLRIWRITIYFSPRLITKYKFSWDFNLLSTFLLLPLTFSDQSLRWSSSHEHLLLLLIYDYDVTTTHSISHHAIKHNSFHSYPFW